MTCDGCRVSPGESPLGAATMNICRLCKPGELQFDVGKLLQIKTRWPEVTMQSWSWTAWMVENWDWIVVASFPGSSMSENNYDPMRISKELSLHSSQRIPTLAVCRKLKLCTFYISCPLNTMHLFNHIYMISPIFHTIYLCRNNLPDSLDGPLLQPYDCV